MNPVYLFGYKLAQMTNQSEAAGVGLICLALKDAGRNPQEPNYQDFNDIFFYHLPKRLEKLQISNRAQIMKELNQMLKENQSLFTLGAH